MDLKSILGNGDVLINATSDFETLRLCADGFNLDAYKKDTRLNVTFLWQYIDETETCVERTVATMKFYISKYKEYDDIGGIADFFGYPYTTNAFTVQKYLEMCEKNPDENAICDYACPKRNIIACQLIEFYISTEYRGIGLSEYLLCMIPTILNEYLGIASGIVSTCIYPYEYQGRIVGDVLSKSRYDYNNVDLMKIMEKSLLKVGFVRIGEEDEFVTDLHRLDHTAMERKYKTKFTGNYFGYNYEL